jgi:hypothetical protein
MGQIQPDALADNRHIGYVAGTGRGDYFFSWLNVRLVARLGFLYVKKSLGNSDRRLR